MFFWHFHNKTKNRKSNEQKSINNKDKNSIMRYVFMYYSWCLY